MDRTTKPINFTSNQSANFLNEGSEFQSRPRLLTFVLKDTALIHFNFLALSSALQLSAIAPTNGPKLLDISTQADLEIPACRFFSGFLSISDDLLTASPQSAVLRSLRNLIYFFTKK